MIDPHWPSLLLGFGLGCALVLFGAWLGSGR